MPSYSSTYSLTSIIQNILDAITATIFLKASGYILSPPLSCISLQGILSYGRLFFRGSLSSNYMNRICLMVLLAAKLLTFGWSFCHLFILAYTPYEQDLDVVHLCARGFEIGVLGQSTHYNHKRSSVYPISHLYYFLLLN